MPSNPRATAARVIFSVAYEGNNLDDGLDRHLSQEDSNTAFIKAMCFGVMRFYPRLLFFLGHLLDKPIKEKEKLIECLLLAGIYETYYMQTPEHASVSETVSAALDLKKQWARGLVNAVLRSALREKDHLHRLAENNEGARTAHPKWLIKLFKQHWPEEFESIIAANNQPGPFTLRVNLQKTTRENYKATLEKKGVEATLCPYSAAGLQCNTALDVIELPGFENGLVSVQDQAAQLAASLLHPQAGERVLDACAAPGGKTGHLLEACPEIRLTAIDISQKRLEKVAENLRRLGVSAEIRQGDAQTPADWWDSVPFDRILLDAPCSASGVIRRHPDIKLLRRREDIKKLAETQAQMLFTLWPLLKTGGMLLYSTCSILAEENDQQIQRLIQNNNNAREQIIDASWGHERPFGRQILPGEGDMDGFFYTLIYKVG
jgi:16S rRNA (cytosine967-C5)-methyltransferase